MMQEAHLWTQHGDTCYQVRNETKRKYDPGRDYAGTLLGLRDTKFSAENNWIWETFKEQYTGSRTHMWLGCNNTSGQWVCLGDTEDNKYRNWMGGVEPNATNACAYMKQDDGTWDAVDCGIKGKWTMCEAPAQPPVCPLKVQCNAVAIPSGSCPVPIYTVKVASPMQCCLACAKQCNCRSFSLTGNIDCQMNLGKINDPVTTLTNQACEYYEYETQN